MVMSYFGAIDHWMLVCKKIVLVEFDTELAIRVQVHNFRLVGVGGGLPGVHVSSPACCPDLGRKEFNIGHFLI